MPPSDSSYSSFAQTATPLGPYNVSNFMHQIFAGQDFHVHLVKVMSVTNTGQLAAVGSVDVMILVNQIDGTGTATPHGIIHNLPYFRLQGGANAIIIDPQVGDIGMAAFADRDISSVKANKAQANPGSRRQFDPADGLYIGGFLNGVPTQFAQWSTDGITIHSPVKVIITAPEIDLTATTKVVITAPNVNVNATTQCTITAPETDIVGNLVVSGTFTQGSDGGAATMQGPLTVINEVTGAGIVLGTHVHGGVTTGGGDTGVPVP